MKIDIYKSTEADDKYVSVPEGSDVTQLDFPDDVDPDFLNLSVFKTGLELDLGKPRVGLNQEEIHKQIIEKGYAIHGATLKATISLAGSSFI